MKLAIFGSIKNSSSPRVCKLERLIFSGELVGCMKRLDLYDCGQQIVIVTVTLAEVARRGRADETGRTQFEWPSDADSEKQAGTRRFNLARISGARKMIITKMRVSIPSPTFGLAVLGEHADQAEDTTTRDSSYIVSLKRNEWPATLTTHSVLEGCWTLTRD